MSSSQSHRDSQSLPRIAISVGDVAGIGPEVALKAIADRRVLAKCMPILVGPVTAIRCVADCLSLSVPNAISPDQACSATLPAMIDCGEVDVASLQPGRFDAATGLASFRAVEMATDMAISGAAGAVVTGPIQKEAWRDAGIDYPGHTEFLADRTNTAAVRMMLTSEEISCLLVTIHIPLADVSDQLTTSGIVESIRMANETLTRRHGRPARVCVCGLNPHAGENGLFSHGEERDIIMPAVEMARQMGINVNGPVPPDTAFTKTMRRQTDVYVCMYHDQGLIPLKALSFDDAVNVTLGMPIVRTSVDHGTAMDIAWQGIASTTSMIAAIETAIDLA